MNKNTHNYSDNYLLSSLIYSIFYWLLYIIIIIILFNIFDYNSCIVYCDSNEPIDQFFVEDSSNKSLLHSNFSDDAYCSSILGKYKNIGKRKIAWFIFEKDKGNYANYKEYKKSWNSNTDILSQIKKELKSDIHNGLHKLKVNKRTLSWVFKGSKPGGGRGL